MNQLRQAQPAVVLIQEDILPIVQTILDLPVTGSNIEHAFGISVLGRETGNAVAYALGALTRLHFSDVGFIFEDLLKIGPLVTTHE